MLGRVVYLAVVTLSFGEVDQAEGVLEGRKGEDAPYVAAVEPIEAACPCDGDEQEEETLVEDGLGVGSGLFAGPDTGAASHPRGWERVRRGMDVKKGNR